MTATPSDASAVIPELVTKAHRALAQEMAALQQNVQAYANEPQSAGLIVVEQEQWKAATHHTERAPQRRLWLQGQQFARLVLANVFDHLWSTLRVLGAPDSITLYSHQTLIRVVCEGAARIVYLLDPGINYEHRLLRIVVMRLGDLDAQIAATRDVVGAYPQLASGLSDAIKQRDDLLQQAERAGISIRRDRNGKPSKLELRSQEEPTKLNLSDLVARSFPERPASYRSSSGIVHSNPWMLIDAVVSDHLTPELVLEPDLAGIGAAVLTALDGCMLITRTYASFYGHDAEPALRRSRLRSQVIDRLVAMHMRG